MGRRSRRALSGAPVGRRWPAERAMVVLRGGPALSAFRVDKLLNAARAVAPGLRSLRADWVHLVSVERELSASDHATLEALLTYGSEPLREPAGPDRTTAVVVPRPGTISPWSSKATDIVHNAGLTAVSRVERGAVWAFERVDGGLLDVAERAALWPLIHDRMVEAVLDRVDQAAVLFDRQEPARLTTVPVLAGGEAALKEADRALGLALSDDEIAYLVEAFVRLERDPTDVELMMFAQANSEHCRHKIFNASWTVDGRAQERSLFGMIRNTHEVSPGRVLSAYKDNAAVVRGPVEDRWLVDPETGHYRYEREPVHLLMKVETHNHPTAISPDPGAGTGNGGEIRDEGATGRGAKPKAGLSGFHVSHLRIPGFEQPWEATPGKPTRIASPLEIMVHGPLGGAAYNNEFGRPGLTGAFRTFELEVEGPEGPQWRGYHKPIMIAGGVGNVRDGHVIKRGIEPGDALVVLGGPAMLIGLGGGAASSMGQGTSTEALDFASVQRANPELQRRCQEVIDRCVALGARNPIASIHDVGAGGLSNALPELVHDAGRGAEIALRAVPSAEPGLSPMALWCNEAQERYVLAIRPAELETFEAICRRERAPFAVVGRATAPQRLRVDDTRLGDTPIDLPMEVLFGKPPRMHRVGAHQAVGRRPFATNDLDLDEAALRVLRFPAVAAKQFLITIGDRSITGLVARDQLVGPWQVPVADVAVTATGYHAVSGEAMAMGERSPLALLDAAASARMAVGESLTNLAAARIAALGDVVLSANWMASAGDPVEDAALFDAVKAVGMELCPALGICIPVGKDSLSMRTVWSEAGRTQRVSAPVSLIVSAFAPVVDVRGTLTPQLRTDQGETALVAIDLGFGRNRLGGSALAQVYGQLGAGPPDLDEPSRLVGFWHAIQELAAAGALLAYHDRSDGGLFATVCEMGFAGHVGVEVAVDPLGDDPVAALFSEELGAVIQVRVDELDAVLGTLRGHGLAGASHVVGTVGGDRIRFTAGDRTLVEGTRVGWQRAWWETTFRIQELRDEPGCARQEYDAILDEGDPGTSPVVTFDPRDRIGATLVGRPRVAILREQGVNGQMEMAAAFDRAGFQAIDVHMSDVVGGREDLSGFVGLVACGGFSYGDVLGAGGGWARTILFQPRAREVFSRYFERGDTFSLGVCNGCQMMALLHDLIPGAEAWPRFVRNTSEQFEGRVATVEILPSPSLFFSGMVGSRLPVAVAHGEGRALFAGGDREALEAAGLVSARFVDNRGAPTERYPLNPNGSPGGITGLTTRDGRVTLMMPHPERVFRTVAHSWAPDGWGEDSPWMRMFRNARVAVG